jgi:hypothetical protein
MGPDASRGDANPGSVNGGSSGPTLVSPRQGAAFTTEQRRVGHHQRLVLGPRMRPVVPPVDALHEGRRGQALKASICL